MSEMPDVRIPGITIDRPLARAARSLLFEVRDADGGGRHGLLVLRDVQGNATTRLGDALATLRAVDHPNVARLVAVQRADGHASLLLDLVEGPSLAQALADEPFTVEQVDDLGRGILAGLQALHEAGYTHPRIGLDDVLLSVGATGPVPRIVGAGVSSFVAGARNDPRDDVFAVGLLLHTLLTGRVPDPEETLTELGPEVPERMTQAVCRALRGDLDQRAQSIREVLTVWEGRNEPGTERVAPARAWDERSVSRLRRLWSDATPVERTWDELVTDPRILAPRRPTLTWLPGAVVAGLLAFLALMSWWGS